MINGKIAVHLRAPVLSASGYGVHARQIMDYLLSDDRFLVFLENIPWGNCPFVHDYDFEDKDRLKTYYSCMANYDEAQRQNVKYDISMQVTIPNEFSRRAELNIGITAGIEVDRCTLEWINKCNEMDMIIVPSTFSAQILSQTVYKGRTQDGREVEQRLARPLYVIPEWFEKPKGELPDLKLNFSTKKNLLFVGLWGNKGGFGEDRKNVSDLIRMFLTHFGDNPDYGLVLKTSIITNSPEDLHHTREKIAQIKSNFKNVKAKIHLIHEHLSDAEMWSLYNHPSILGMVSLTHGEGWGLPLLEASAAGLPVLATDWSGHKDFLREKHGFIPLAFQLNEVPQCQIWDKVIDKGSRWACVEEEDVKRRFKKFLESSAPIRKLAKENISWIEENFGKEAVSKKWRELFDSFIRSSNTAEGGSDNPEVLRELAHREQVSNIAREIREKYGVGEKTDESRKVAYFMPRSFGDVVISTAVMNSLVCNRHSGDEFYFVTSPEYREIADALVSQYGVKVLDWDDHLMNTEVVREIWDVVYNPTVNVQYSFSNWNLGDGEFGVRLLEEFAKHCNLAPGEVLPYCLSPKQVRLPKKQYIAITAVSSKQAKNYKHWDDVVYNLKKMADVEVVQLGMKSEKLIDGCLDYRGLSFNETIYVVSRAVLHLSPDTGTAHVAGATGTPHIVLFATTSPYQCAPTLFKSNIKQIIIDSAAAKEPRSYRDIDPDETLSAINSQTICQQAYEILKGIRIGETHLPVLRFDQEEMDRLVNAWHDSSGDVSLHEHLGLTQEQYTKWVENKCELL